MKIDVHAHYIPERFFTPDGTIRVTRERSEEVLYHASRRTGAGKGIYDLELRLKEMDAQGVDLHVMSVLPPLFVNHIEPQKAVAACRVINDAFAEAVSRHPRRLVAIANLPMQAPQEAARELERAVKDLGMKGAEICTNIAGKNLDDESLAPFYRKMQELDVPVFLHPNNVLGQDRLARYHLGNLIGNPTDTAVAAASLIFGGVLKEFPRLKFYLAHGGGSCPYLRGRWEHGWRVRAEAKVNIQRPPSEYVPRLYFDSLTHSGPALNFLVETMGPERVMLGTDYPADMSDPDPVKTIASLPHLSDAEREMIYGANAMRLFQIG
ncbi:MAG TPA: amidohydrolase family protein [Candidatus Acidoferrales bacterium]|nr:amidohydrolase family protein [Candidatus Acidoferrales bacterium]